MSITNELYDTYATKSFITDNNFSGRFAPSNISSNMVPYDKLQEFHYQTSFFLNFYSSLYIELKKYESTINYNITTFASNIENMGIKFNTTDYSSSASVNYNLSTFSLNTTSGDPRSNVYYDFTFFIKRFEEKTNNQSHLYEYGTLGANVSYDSRYSNIIDKSKPNFGSYPNILTAASYSNNLILKSATISITGGISSITSPSYLVTGNILTRANSLSSVPETTKIIKEVNRSKFKKIIEEIFSQTPENILGYLLNKKIYYNVILYNISIQNAIRLNYLNQETGTGSTNNIILIGSNANLIITSSCSSGNCDNLNAVNSFITDNTTNIFQLNNIHFNTQNDFLLEKNEYRNKINVLNTLKDDYMKVQDKLNISTKLYNQQFKNYQSIKKYATYIIIALIIILISIISISIFPIFSNDIKNGLYIIILVILIVITYLYYTNFKYVNLYEKFAATQALSSIVISNGSSNSIIFSQTTPTHRNNHANFYNQLLPAANQYQNAINDLMNNLRMNVYTIGSKTFSQDANIYLYNLYLEKKRQLENNKIKLTNLFNMIEVIKKQINYLFNIIFIIACFAIILLLALVIYSNAPQLYIFVIILCVVLISILMTYFAFAIIQPTRMIANKNYWAIVNPSKIALSRL